MIAGFTLSLISVISNDSLQTLGPYLLANQSRTPKSWQMAFLCAITISVLMLGWLLNGGDPAWGRLNVPGHVFTQPAVFTWVYLIPPLAMLLLTQWGAPLSTSFLVLSTFEFRNSSALIHSSLSGYIVAFLIGVITYGLGFWVFERWVFESNQSGSSIGNNWLIAQWLSTAFLWGIWLVQDLANVFIFLPRQLELLPMLMCTVLLCLGLCWLISVGGGPIQGILNTKTNASDLRSATAIDLLFGSCLLGCAWFTSFPLSTTWVFLGLLGGREGALRFHSHRSGQPFANQDGGHWSQVVGSDLSKASVALVVSVLIASGLQSLL